MSTPRPDLSQVTKLAAPYWTGAPAPTVTAPGVGGDAGSLKSDGTVAYVDPGVLEYFFSVV